MGNCWPKPVASAAKPPTPVHSDRKSPSKNNSPRNINNITAPSSPVKDDGVVVRPEEPPRGEIVVPNLKMFTFAELRSATRNFKPATVLGEGGFGTVFRGWIDEKTHAPSKVGHGIPVAVKKSNSDSSQGFKEWQDFNAKLSDFGLAKLGPANGDSHVSTGVVGTYGYAAPEYVATGAGLLIVDEVGKSR
ncbi:hypothetical protein RJ640_020717 [Escallonia rubra]|uniref:Uncharacterized protein n=1 Tax=Escallonia rubra TaxID=112253 RepID=A0AA88RT30_9ASTE|nr:hypothetical protein RJ640_020717 [Escallonia rubra]